MKLLFVIYLVACSLRAQIEPGQVQTQQIGGLEDAVRFGEDNLLLYKVQRINGTKTLLFEVLNCNNPGVGATVAAGLLVLPFLAACTMVRESTAEQFDATQAVLDAFYDQYPDGEQWYVPLAPSSAPPPSATAAVHPHLATAQPSAPPNPHLVDFDGFSNNIYDFDLTTFATLSTVMIPYSVSAIYSLAIRPTATGPDNEVWGISVQGSVYVVDIGAGKIITTIPIPSSIQNNSNTVQSNRTTGFTSSGATFFYAVPYVTPDSAGNKGALLVFDVASRTLTSTLLLKTAPAVLVVAPDGLTVYLLANDNITYYDVLSGTADLSVPLDTPAGSPNYFDGYGSVFIHPDGTRLFWGSAGFSVFDLTSRQITNTFPVTLPAGVSNVTFQMSPDGSTFAVSYDGSGTVPSGTILMDVNGNLLGTSLSAINGILTTYIGPGN